MSDPTNQISYLAAALKAPASAIPQPGWRSRPETPAGPMRTTSSPSSTEKSPPATPPGRSYASAILASVAGLI